MKKSDLSLITALALASAALTSCSLMQKNVKTEAQLPSDRETVTTPASNAEYRSKALEHGAIGGYWAIAEVGGKKAVGEEPPYLKFETETHRVYGNNGCNVLNGSYTSNPADSTLSFSELATTMRLCATEGLSETDINQALGFTRHYTWSRENLLYKVTLLSADYKPLMTLVHQNYEFLNGTWTVSALGRTPVDKPDIKLVIDVEEQKIHGNTGCNILNGSLIPDMLSPGALTFTNLSTTRMMCPDIELETSLLVALEEVTVARPVNTASVDLLDAQGQCILTLRRVDDN